MKFSDRSDAEWFKLMEYLNKNFVFGTQNYDGGVKLEVELSDGTVLRGMGDTLKEALEDFASVFVEEYRSA